MAETVVGDLTEQEAVAYRAEFPIFDHTTYLNSCSLGPLSRRAIDALADYQADWSMYGAPAWWLKWLPQIDRAKQRFAQLIGAQPHEVTISHSISSALSSIAGTFDYRDKHAVVCADLDFPTIAYQWLSRRRSGVDVRFARSEDSITVPYEAYEALVDDRVAHIATSHVFYATGYTQPIRRLADLAHERGGKIIVDGYHSVGVMPVDMKALDVDFYVGGVLKWLMGGPGLTFIYVREDLIPTLQPTATGWFAAADQFAFDTANMDFAPTADRLEMGTPSIPTTYAGIAGMDMVLEAQPERIYRRIQMLTDYVVERATSAGYRIMSPENRSERGGIVMLALKRPQETVQALAERNITVDYRPGLVRISPHFYNTVDDVESVMDQIDALQRS